MRIATSLKVFASFRAQTLWHGTLKYSDVVLVRGCDKKSTRVKI
jgi:hypothetical protein